MSDQSTEPSEDTGSSIDQTKSQREMPSRIDMAIWMFFVYVLLVWILITLVNIHTTIVDQKDQDAQAYSDQYDMTQTMYEIQEIICDALNGPDNGEGNMTPIKDNVPPIPTSTTIPGQSSTSDSDNVPPGEARPPVTHPDNFEPIEAYC